MDKWGDNGGINYKQFTAVKHRIWNLEKPKRKEGTKINNWTTAIVVGRTIDIRTFFKESHVGSLCGKSEEDDDLILPAGHEHFLKVNFTH